MSVVGFDFGTTNSLISLIKGGRAINFLDNEQRPIPSIACYEGTEKIFGRDAKKRISEAGLGVKGNIVRSPKMYLDRESIFVEGVEKSPVDVVCDVVSYVVREARRSSRELSDLTTAVVTIPVDMDGARRRRLRSAFLQAGIRIVQFVHEPLAALYGFFRRQDLAAMLRKYDKKPVLVFDWGGGTLDLTLCRPIGGILLQVLNDGTDSVGGDVFDEAIMNRLVKYVATARGIGEAFDLHLGAKARLLDKCERSKIDLSSRSDVSVYVGNFFRGIEEEEFDYTLTQAEMEQIVEPLLDTGFKRIQKILEASDFAPEQIALCLATGGMSNMPAVKRRLDELFGPERVQIPDNTSTLIAEGAAWIAADNAGLHLAKNIELLFARNSYFSVVKAGTEMPKEGEVQKDTFHLYCTDPRDGIAKFQICSPARPGMAVLPGDPRTNLNNMTVKVDALAKPFHERLELDISVDEDLILTTHARSLNKKDQDRCEIHNLEFGLKFPNLAERLDFDFTDQVVQNVKGATPGELSLRSNVANREDDSLVPGELLFKHDPSYFDVRSHPPQYQVHERLYYEPCSTCGLASNDPICKCG
jgi:molecular chaperone DnaK